MGPERMGHRIRPPNFRARKKPEESRPRILAQILRDAATHWIQLEGKTTEEVVDIVVLEQFVRDLEINTQKWVKRHQPCFLMEALRVAKDL